LLRYNYLPRLPLFTIRAIPFPRRQLSSFWARLDPAPFSLPSLFPAATLGLVPPVRYHFLRRRHPFSSPHVPSTYGRRSAPLLLNSPLSGQHTLHLSCSGVSAGGGGSSPFLPRLSWHTALSSLPHAHARAGAFCKAPFSRPTATVVLSSSRYLYFWPLLYPLTTAFSTFLGACLTSPTLGCLLQKVLHHLLSYDCPGTLLLSLFPMPMLHPYHRILIILDWM
jgi:hypothetical protein